VSQPSLRITHVEGNSPVGDFVFDVWNPAEARYEACASFEQGLERVGKLAHDMREMWIGKDPALAGLAPPPPVTGDAEFAELRVTSQAQRHYDIRSFDAPDWAHFRGYIAQAGERICAEVGYVVPPVKAPELHVRRAQSVSTVTPPAANLDAMSRRGERQAG
jgi:hypothetical protein